MVMLPRIYESSRGGEIASLLGFDYLLSRESDGVKQYRCRHHRKFKCNVTMHTERGKVSKPPTGEHTHPSSGAGFDLGSQVAAEMKESA